MGPTPAAPPRHALGLVAAAAACLLSAGCVPPAAATAASASAVAVAARPRAVSASVTDHHRAMLVGDRWQALDHPRDLAGFHGRDPLAGAKRLARESRAERLRGLVVLDPSATFQVANSLVMPFYALMLAVPRWHMTAKIMQSNWLLLPFSILYFFLLKQSWRPDFFELLLPGSIDKWHEGVQFMPTLPGVMELLSGQVSMASVWVHLLVVDLFMARALYLDSYRNSMRVPMKHTILLCWMFGPIGLLSHVVTKAIVSVIWPRSSDPGEKD